MTLPVNLYEAKEQLQLGDDYTHDAEVDGFLQDAAAWVEKFTGHILEARQVTEQFLGFDRLQLRAWPILPGAALTVTYTDTAGSTIAVTGARVDVSRRPARVFPSLGSHWPVVMSGTQATVTVRAGYEDEADVPRNLRRAILVLVAAYDADREGGDILAKAETSARRLCDRYRLRRL
jgi:uncharacterized phiE125 gp8 family phage protein